MFSVSCQSRLARMSKHGTGEKCSKMGGMVLQLILADKIRLRSNCFCRTKMDIVVKKLGVV